MEYFFIFLGSLALGVVGAFISIYLFPRIGLMDFPGRYGHKRDPIPYPVGISFFIVFLLSIIIFFNIFNVSLFKNIKLWAFLVASLILVTVSFLDDRYQISPVFRLLIQIFCAAIVISFGVSLGYLTNPMSSNPFELPILLGGFLSLFWIVGFINTANWLDGVPNLTLGATGVSALTLAFLSISERVNQPETAFLSFCFAGVCIGFIIPNFFKTQFLLGDTGSMFAGFSIAVFSLFAGGKLATALIVMALPIFDAIYVFTRRIIQKKSPLKGGDKTHLHDVLLLKGWSNIKIFSLFLFTSSTMGISALFLETIGKIILIFCFAFLYIGFRVFLEKNLKNLLIKK